MHDKSPCVGIAMENAMIAVLMQEETRALYGKTEPTTEPTDEKREKKPTLNVHITQQVFRSWYDGAFS